MTRQSRITVPGVLLLVAVTVIGLRLVAFGFVSWSLALVPMVAWAVSVAMRASRHTE
jgi:hypothetical protein